MYLGWRGPSWNDFEVIAAIDVLHSYLTGGASSPLHASLVDCEEPLCSGVHYSLLENKVRCVYNMKMVSKFRLGNGSYICS